jgi:hypothetical protein
MADTEKRTADTEAGRAVSRPCACACAAREVFQKISFTFTSMAENAVYKGFPANYTPEFTFTDPSPILHPVVSVSNPVKVR